MLVEDVDEADIELQAVPAAAEPPKESPAAMGLRLADAAFPLWHRVTQRKFEKLVRKKVASRVRLPRAAESMQIKFKLDLAPLQAVKKMCEDAGMQLINGPRRSGGSTRRTWKAAGPSSTAKFAQLDRAHALGFGGAKLKGPSKDDSRKRCRAMALLAPPLTVEHTTDQDREEAVIKAYLVTYNQEGELGLPPKHEEICWGDAAMSTERLPKKYAKKMLDEMGARGLALSQTFLKQLGGGFCSSGDETSEWEEGDE